MDPIRLGLVGVNFGRYLFSHIVAHQQAPVRLTSVCDLDTAKAAAVAAELGVPTSPSLDALLDDPQIDAICLITPPKGRAELIRKIIRAGKDVMTTKPFEIDAQAALDVLYEARALGRVLHMNSPNARPYGEMVYINEWLASGAIGTPLLAQSSTWADYGPTPAEPGSWYDDPLRCPVAPIFRISIYPLNNLMQIFGEPNSVQVTEYRVVTTKPTPDNASLTIGFKNGGIANLMGSLVIGGLDRYKNAMTIAGSKGVIYFMAGPRDQHGMTFPQLILATDDRCEVKTLTSYAGDYDWEFFAQRVRGEVAQDVTTPEDIVRSINVVQAMSQAEQSGQTVKVPSLPTRK
jgi:predicted dehydrogenase